MQHSRKVTVGFRVHDLIARTWLRGAIWWHLRPKYFKIYHKNNINDKILGGTVTFELKNSYKLRMVVQQRTLGTHRDVDLSGLLLMSYSFFNDLFPSHTFANLPLLN